ncbi:unnamed protein product [Allacma fusca]|uniref:Uncharacterized protein n=1 Tax=Allacma fusca TaxID=39272 RepID=A0A8J2KD38_9HEXA|nr:unnamed protein product [Allacma fusca]
MLGCVHYFQGLVAPEKLMVLMLVGKLEGFPTVFLSPHAPLDLSPSHLYHSLRSCTYARFFYTPIKHEIGGGNTSPSPGFSFQGRHKEKGIEIENMDEDVNVSFEKPVVQTEESAPCLS